MCSSALDFYSGEVHKENSKYQGRGSFQTPASEALCITPDMLKGECSRIFGVVFKAFGSFDHREHKSSSLRRLSDVIVAWLADELITTRAPCTRGRAAISHFKRRLFRAWAIDRRCSRFGALTREAVHLAIRLDVNTIFKHSLAAHHPSSMPL